MLSIAFCLVTNTVRLAVDLVPAWLVVMHTYLYHPLSLYRTWLGLGFGRCLHLNPMYNLQSANLQFICYLCPVMNMVCDAFDRRRQQSQHRTCINGCFAEMVEFCMIFLSPFSICVSLCCQSLRTVQLELARHTQCSAHLSLLESRSRPSWRFLAKSTTTRPIGFMTSLSHTLRYSSPSYFEL